MKFEDNKGVGRTGKHADLDDSRVVAVRREDGQLHIDLERFGTEHIHVCATGVSREDAEYYVGDRVSEPHPDPNLPLDRIEVAEIGKGFLELQGHLNNDSWYVWRIVAEAIEITRESNDKKPT